MATASRKARMRKLKDVAPAPRKRRGFAAMDPDQRREIARRGGEASHEAGRAPEWSRREARSYGRQGGRAAHERGTAHEWDRTEAREYGREGGRIAHERGSAHEWDSKEARAAGRLGGRARWTRKAKGPGRRVTRGRRRGLLSLAFDALRSIARGGDKGKTEGRRRTR
jgi:uncharacterized protein